MPSPMWLARAGAVVVLFAPASPAALVYDDFSGPTINPALWTTVLPTGSSSLTFDTGRLRFQSRAYLNSLDDFDPFDQPVSVAGRWEFGAPNDFLQVATRSQGQPQGSYSENNNGVELLVRPHASEVTIQQWVNGAFTELATFPISIQAGDIFDFQIVDDGATFSFTLSEVGGEGVVAGGNANTTLNTGYSKVTVHNRETAPMYGFLDEITIQTIPTPAPIAPIATLGALGIVRRRR